MHRNSATRLSVSFVSVGIGLSLVATSLLASEQVAPSVNRTPSVGSDVAHVITTPMRDFRFVGPVSPVAKMQVRNDIVPKKRSGSAPVADPVVQKQFGKSQPDEVGQFEGLSDDDNAVTVGTRFVPPDTNGDVGPNHYVEYINGIWAVYDKTGTLVMGPLPGNSLWQSLPGNCKNTNNGDPVAKYDKFADRWVLTQFSVTGTSYDQCIAVSATGDPTGAYYAYDFLISPNVFNDYPKLGIWPDGYYVTFNGFPDAGGFEGLAFAFDRSKMLVGSAAASIGFSLGDSEGGLLPSDLDGMTPPPVGAPNYLLDWYDTSTLHMFEFHVDWAVPANSTMTGPIAIPVSSFIVPVCANFRDQCVPQLGSTELLETLVGDMMFRLPYRNFGDHEALVGNFTVGTADGPAAIRWFEIRNPGPTPTLYQESTYAPDSSYRWMGSIAQDASGDMALGYSKSDTTIYPSIAITGRLPGDTLGTMGAEDVFLNGGGSQTASFNRWGDYSSMSIDPTDDCTFWYAQQYYAATGSFDFKTRIASFKFPSCTNPVATGSISGTVTDGVNPIPGVFVTAGPYSRSTDASGNYQFAGVPVGSYDMTALKYGYTPGAASGIVVAEGANTVQDFVLGLNLTLPVNGVVKDGSGQGWPLFARVEILPGPGGFPGATIYTDPVTGYYSTNLVAGLTYDFVVTSVNPGYAPGGGPVTVSIPPGNGPGAVVVNWSLVAGGACNAPGYVPGTLGTPVLDESFDAGTLPPGWAIDTPSGPGWEIHTGADPCGEFGGNRTGGTGPFALLNSNDSNGDCNQPLANDDSSLITKSVDLSTLPNAVINWANDYIDLGTSAQVDVSIDGGANWTNVWSAVGSSVPGPGTQTADMTFAIGHPDVKARFHFQGYWGWWWQVDNVKIAPTSCTPVPGGLIVGTVTDSNSGTGLNGATVANLPQPGSPKATTATTPSQGAGYYTLFNGSGSQSFEASKDGYAALTKNVTVVPNGVTRLDFSLLAGKLGASPRPLTMVLNPGGIQSLTLNLSNSGTGSGTFSLKELNAPASAAASAPHPSFATALDRMAAIKRIPFARQNARDPKGLSPLPKPAKPLANPPAGTAGNVVSSFAAGVASPFGVAYNTDANNLWVTSPDAPADSSFGDGLDHQYLPDGMPTGNTIDITSTGGEWQADGTYNVRTGMMWNVNVGGDNCLYESDPTTAVVTGKKICGSAWTATSQRGVAYDPLTDTYYVGGWNEGIIYHIDSAGNVLDSANVGLFIGGLAFNPSTGHLFVYDAVFFEPIDMWVLDPRNGYAVVNEFNITSGGNPVFPTLAGMDMSCDGHLWLVDQNTGSVLEVDSGESSACVLPEIPWLSESPTSGTVPASVGGQPASVGTNPFPVMTTFDATGLLPGLRQAQLLVKTDTPYPIAPVPVNLTVLFNDVSQGGFAWNFISGAAGAGIMRGCSFYDFCPNMLVTRAAMAGYIERAVHGPLTSPPVYQAEFQDVFYSSFNADYIQGLVDDGITAGCNVSPRLYCPDAPIPREQMAVFILLGKHGSGWVPPACVTPIFDDVPCSNGFSPWVNALYNEGITAGCSTSPKLFCPDHDPSNPAPTNGWSTNAEMAVFLSVAFNLPHVP